MSDFDIKGVQQVKNMLGALPQNLQSQALAMALNKVGAKAKTTATRAITRNYNIKASVVRKTLHISPARRRNADTTFATLQVFNSSTGKRSLNLIHFVEGVVSLTEMRRRKKNESRPQLRFKIRKDQPAVVKPGAFIGNKGRTVFIRMSPERLDIIPLQVIDVPGMFKAHRVLDPVIARVQKEMQVEVQRSVALLLSRMAQEAGQ